MNALRTGVATGLRIQGAAPSRVIRSAVGSAVRGELIGAGSADQILGHHARGRTALVGHHRITLVNASITLFDIPLVFSLWIVPVTMSMGMLVEQKQPEDIGQQTEAADNADEHWALDFLGFHESLDGFEEDGHTEGDQKDTVYQRTEGLCPLPLSPEDRLTQIQQKSVRRLTP